MEPLHISNTTTTTTMSSAPNFVRRLIWTIVSLFLIITLIIAIAWFILNPWEPRFRVNSLSVSNFSATDSQLRGKYEIDLDITNPNKKIRVMVDHFKFFVCYRSMVLSVPEMVQQPPILVDKKGDNKMKVELRLKDTPPKKLDLFKDWDKGVVNFNVRMKVRVRFEDGIWPIKEKFLEVYCEDLDVGFVPIKDTGKLLGIGKDCGVDVKLEEEDDEDEESKP